VSYLGEGSDFRQQNRPKPKRVGFSDVGNRGSYTPGGDSYKNYSQKDQQTMFRQAGGEKAFKENVANIEQKYKRSADVQRFLDRSKQYFNAQSLGATPSNVGGINRLNFTTPGMPVMRDAFGRQILSMQAPSMTAQAPTFRQFMGDIGGGISDMMGAGADFIMGGGTLGRVLGGFKDKFTQGKNFVGELTNPGDIRGRVNALSPEQQRVYYQLLPTMTYQQAFEQASGVPFAMGGIASLN
jgi:hypothetical protein